MKLEDFENINQKTAPIRKPLEKSIPQLPSIKTSRGNFGNSRINIGIYRTSEGGTTRVYISSTDYDIREFLREIPDNTEFVFEGVSVEATNERFRKLAEVFEEMRLINLLKREDHSGQYHFYIYEKQDFADLTRNIPKINQ